MAMTQYALLNRSSLQALSAPAAPLTVTEPVWRLLLTAMFAAGAAFCFAAVVIFGAPGGDAFGPSAEPVQVVVHTAAS